MGPFSEEIHLHSRVSLVAAKYVVLRSYLSRRSERRYNILYPEQFIIVSNQRAITVLIVTDTQFAD